MQIHTTPQGYTYVGYSQLTTIEEFQNEIDCIFASKPYPRIAQARAKALGGQKYRGKRFGGGFIFPHETEDSLRKKAKKLYPQLF